MLTLRERFERFMLSGKGVESIDELMRQCNLPNRKWADYLAFNRSVIIEQKSLDVDPDYKIANFLNDLIKSGRLIFWGQQSVTRLLEKLPGGNALKQQLVGKVTKVIDDILANADKQTRYTRMTFVIPHALGIVVILNESAQFLAPDLVTYQVMQTLKKRTDEKIRYPNNHAVVLISEAHLCGPLLIPIQTIISDVGAQNPAIANVAETIVRAWCGFNGVRAVSKSGTITGCATRLPKKIIQL
jgi:hypothetical protein